VPENQFDAFIANIVSFSLNKESIREDLKRMLSRKRAVTTSFTKMKDLTKKSKMMVGMTFKHPSFCQVFSIYIEHGSASSSINC
jgi:hypothetical protein